MLFLRQVLQMFLIMFVLSCSTGAYSQSINLKDKHNNIVIDTNSLHIQWNGVIVNDDALSVNHHSQHSSKANVSSDFKATWVLQPSNVKVNAQLSKGNLIIGFEPSPTQEIKRAEPLLVEWFNLPEKLTQTLLLPFSEGMRVLTKDTAWSKFLIDNYNNSNTTQDLKMPFWTAKQGEQYITYHLVDPYNNKIHFSKPDEHLDMRLDHSFTVLNKNDAFSVRISMGTDWLDGAKNYRNWRIEHGESNTLLNKLKHNKNIEKLIGASQVYLFGKGVISTEDVTNWKSLNKWYLLESQLPSPSFSVTDLSSLLEKNTWFSHYHKRLLVNAINQSLQLKFSTAIPTLRDNTIEQQYVQAQQQKAWLAKHASKFLIPEQQWGQGLSVSMIDNLQKAGLKKLWLGLDNWMPAFYQPLVVDQAKNAGYLVATYDSYNTAIKPGLNDGWLTAQIPFEMNKACQIKLASGKIQKGFRGNGVYLNPNCHFDYVAQRVKDIIKFGHFNSLFIDVDATGMAREDYHVNNSEKAILKGFNDRMSILAKTEHVVLGSEDGNSLTSQGISFAHGLETVGFGWTDKEMKRDKLSPYFLGRWYPDQKPDFFFKPAKVKEPYKTLLFAPQYRVPLYQTVFHDEVINSHHWHSDSLKFSNVKIERDLISMLYNTPAMIHLSRDEVISPKSPRVKALVHYQQGFMKVHEALWDQQLTGFKWLDKKGLVQQTLFSDGSKIIANFTKQTVNVRNHQIAPYSSLALLSSGNTIRWHANP